MYGRGKNVDEETYNYFVRVMERLKEEFEDEEEKGNVFSLVYFDNSLHLILFRNVCRQRVRANQRQRNGFNL